MEGPIALGTETSRGACFQFRSIGLFVCLAVAASLMFGCAKVNSPTVPSAAVHDPVSISSSKTLQPVSPPYSLAILPFEDYSNQPNLSWLRKGLPDMLVTDLALLPGVRVVSRHRLGEVLREQWLQHRGSFEEASSVRLGRLVGARYLLSGQYYVRGDDLVLDVHLLGVEHGAVVRTLRVMGKADTVPDLELDLASRLGQVFDAEGFAQPEEHGGDSFVEDGRPVIQMDSQEIAAMQKTVKAPAHDSQSPVPLTSTLRTDTVLGLERLRHVRDSATRIANDLWEQSLVIRLGGLKYESQSVGNLGKDTLIVRVPLSATIREEAIRQLDSGLTIVDPENSDRESEDIVLRYEETDAGAQQLFREALQSPRRIFVRAIQESGDVLAVSSEWSWRMDMHVQSRPEGTVGIRRLSSPFIQGDVTFGGALLSSHDSTITFDTVIVPVPEESRSVVVEVVDDQATEKEFQANDVAMEAAVKAWLLDHWFPPVGESIPTAGYLPGNRRRGIALVSGKGGRISQVRVIQIDEEEKFTQGVNDALLKLPGTCFRACEEIGPTGAASESFVLRVQFELAKDIQHVGLGRLK